MKLDGWKWIIGCTCANGYCWLPKGGCSVIVVKNMVAWVKKHHYFTHTRYLRTLGI